MQKQKHFCEDKLKKAFFKAFEEEFNDLLLKLNTFAETFDYVQRQATDHPQRDDSIQIKPQNLQQIQYALQYVNSDSKRRLIHTMKDNIWKQYEKLKSTNFTQKAVLNDNGEWVWTCNDKQSKLFQGIKSVKKRIKENQDDLDSIISNRFDIIPMK